MKEINIKMTERWFKRLQKASNFYFDEKDLDTVTRIMVETFIEYIEEEYPKKKTRKTNGAKNDKNLRETKEPKPRRKRTSKAKVQ